MERKANRKCDLGPGNLCETALYSHTFMDLPLNYLSGTQISQSLWTSPLSPDRVFSTSSLLLSSPRIVEKQGGGGRRAGEGEEKQRGKNSAEGCILFLLAVMCVALAGRLLVNVVSTLELSMAFVMCLSWLAPWVTLASKAAFLLTACWGYRCLDNR